MYFLKKVVGIIWAPLASKEICCSWATTKFLLHRWFFWNFNDVLLNLILQFWPIQIFETVLFMDNNVLFLNKLCCCDSCLKYCLKQFSVVLFIWSYLIAILGIIDFFFLIHPITLDHNMLKWLLQSVRTHSKGLVIQDIIKVRKFREILEDSPEYTWKTEN